MLEKPKNAIGRNVPTVLNVMKAYASLIVRPRTTRGRLILKMKSAAGLTAKVVQSAFYNLVLH